MNIRTIVITMLASVSLAGCSSLPEKSAALDEARRIFSEAQHNPEVTKHAAVELQQAQRSLYNAEQAWSKRNKAAEVGHLIYLANQRSAIALETGKVKAAELLVANASNERDKIRLEVRTAQADLSRQQLRKEELAAKQVASDLEASRVRLNQMENELLALDAKKTKRGLVITLGDVLFDLNKSELRPEAEANVQKIANFLNEYPERRALIEGFTDSSGSDRYNQQLSEQRAEAVRAYLIDNGIGRDRVDARGNGEANPIASNDTSANRQRNRRVEILISGIDD